MSGVYLEGVTRDGVYHRGLRREIIEMEIGADVPERDAARLIIGGIVNAAWSVRLCVGVLHARKASIGNGEDVHLRTVRTLWYAPSSLCVPVSVGRFPCAARESGECAGERATDILLNPQQECISPAPSVTRG